MSEDGDAVVNLAHPLRARKDGSMHRALIQEIGFGQAEGSEDGILGGSGEQQEQRHGG